MKEDWKIKKLTDVLWFQEGPGVRKHQYTTSGVKLLNVANLVNGKVDLSTSDRYISEEEAYGKYKHFLADEGDLILASSGIQVEYIEKKMGFITKEHLPLCMNTSTIRFKSLDKGVLDIAFFMYFLKSFHFKEQLSKLITGIAQLNFGPSHLKQMTIPVPSLPEQKRILAELDCLSGVIEKQKQQLKELDNLAQAIFYDMFGDPITNEKGWEVKKLEEIATSQIGITYKPENVSDDGVIVLRSSNIQDSTLAFDDIVRVNCPIKDAKYVKENDILMCSRNGSFRLVGKVAMIPKLSEKMTYGAFMTIIRSDYQHYLFAFFKSPAFRTQLTTAQTATINQITVKMLNEIQVALPPLSLQQEFASKIESIEKQKELIKQSLSETETLFNSRMDYYFN